MILQYCGIANNWYLKMNKYNTEINNSAAVSWHPNVGGGIAT